MHHDPMMAILLFRTNVSAHENIAGTAMASDDRECAPVLGAMSKSADLVRSIRSGSRNEAAQEERARAQGLTPKKRSPPHRTAGRRGKRWSERTARSGLGSLRGWLAAAAIWTWPKR